MNNELAYFKHFHDSLFSMQNVKTYWTFEYGDEIFDCEFDSKEKLISWLENWWADKVDQDNDDLRNGEVYQDECKLIKFHYDENGEMVIEETIDHVLEYEHYHGDFQEHNLYYKGGVL